METINKQAKIIDNVKVHDCIMLNRIYKDPEKSWYGGKIPGIVIALDEKTISMITPDGETMERPLQESEYKTEITQLSEVEFIRLIDESIERRKEKLYSEQKELQKIEKWRKDFVLQISLLGKLYRLAKETFHY